MRTDNAPITVYLNEFEHDLLDKAAEAWDTSATRLTIYLMGWGVRALRMYMEQKGVELPPEFAALDTQLDMRGAEGRWGPDARFKPPLTFGTKEQRLAATKARIAELRELADVNAEFDEDELEKQGAQ